jgi:hypothetical protein
MIVLNLNLPHWDSHENEGNYENFTESISLLLVLLTWYFIIDFQFLSISLLTNSMEPSHSW